MSETRWWFIRHAPVDSGGIIYGQDDLPADCTRSELFDDLAARLPQDAVWMVTNLQRTRQTADALRARVAHAVPEYLVEPAFAEQHFGDWQGRTHSQLRAERHPEWHRFWLAPATERPPAGESFADLTERVGPALRAHSAALAGRDVVCVAHGGTIRAVLSIALDIEPERALGFAVENCSLTRIDRFAGSAGSHLPGDEGSWRVVHVNLPPC
jgi:broad specificity phosphatase PhoE